MRSRKPMWLLFAVSADASAFDDPLGAYASGLGGVAVADPRSNDSTVANPATIALADRYDVTGWGEIGGRRLGGGFAAIDSKTAERVAVGVTYRYVRANPPLLDSELPGWIATGDTPTNQQNGHSLAVAVAVPTNDRAFSAGIGGDVQIVDKERLGRMIEGDLDLGLAIRGGEWFTFGLAGRDLLPLDAADHPIRVASGVRAGSEDLGSFAIDASYRLSPADGSPLTMGVGFERLAGTAAVRGGWRWDGRYEWHVASFGIGIQSEGTWLDLSAEVPFGKPFDARDAVFRLGFRGSG